MSNSFIGRRGSQGDTWSWGSETPAGRAPDRGPGRLGCFLTALTFIASLAALVGLALFFTIADRDDEPGTVQTTGSRPTGTVATGAPSQSSTPSGATAGPASMNRPGISFRFLIWSRAERSWRSDSLSPAPDYREGESIPFMIRIDGAKPDTVYELKLRYNCGTGGRNAVDFLTGLPEADVIAAATAPGPEQERADTTLPIPDDPSISFDDAGVRLFRLWGGVFYQRPRGPLPASPCTDDKTLSLTVRARRETIFLIVGAHLASARDWGEGRGVSSLKTPVLIGGNVDELPAMKLSVPAVAVAP